MALSPLHTNSPKTTSHSHLGIVINLDLDHICLAENRGLCPWVVVDLGVVHGITQGRSAVRRSI